MTPVQIRMARAALELTLDDLAGKAYVPVGEVEALESGGGNPDVAAKLRAFFDAAGVELLGETGVGFDEKARNAARTVPLGELNSANDE